MTKTIKTSSLNTSDPSVCAPDAIKLDSSGKATAQHAASGDNEYESLGELCEAYGLDQAEIESLFFDVEVKKNGSVEFEGKTLALQQQAYIDQDFSAPGQPAVYRASAHDLAGNAYRVQWAIKPEIAALPAEEHPEDESEMCN